MSPKNLRSRRPGVECPHCGGTVSKVLRTRKRGPAVQRVRYCLNCERRFPTRESTAKSDTGIMDLRSGVVSLLRTLESSPLFPPNVAQSK